MEATPTSVTTLERVFHAVQTVCTGVWKGAVATREGRGCCARCGGKRDTCTAPPHTRTAVLQAEVPVQEVAQHRHRHLSFPSVHAVRASLQHVQQPLAGEQLWCRHLQLQVGECMRACQRTHTGQGGEQERRRSAIVLGDSRAVIPEDGAPCGAVSVPVGSLPSLWQQRGRACRSRGTRYSPGGWDALC